MGDDAGGMGRFVAADILSNERGRSRRFRFSAREAPGLRGANEAVEGGQGHVFFIGRGSRAAAQMAAGQPDQAVEVRAPQLCDGFVALAGFQAGEPNGYASGSVHVTAPLEWATGPRLYRSGTSWKTTRSSCGAVCGPRRGRWPP